MHCHNVGELPQGALANGIDVWSVYPTKGNIEPGSSTGTDITMGLETKTRSLSKRLEYSARPPSIGPSLVRGPQRRS